LDQWPQCYSVSRSTGSRPGVWGRIPAVLDLCRAGRLCLDWVFPGLKGGSHGIARCQLQVVEGKHGVVVGDGKEEQQRRINSILMKLCSNQVIHNSLDGCRLCLDRCAKKRRCNAPISRMYQIQKAPTKPPSSQLSFRYSSPVYLA
jgi:hypothetical protein